MSSKDYWQKREAEALKHRITDEKEYDKRLKEIYTNMLNSCQNEINAFYGRYAAKNGITIAEAKKRVSKADMATYKFKAKRYVKEKNFTQQANEEMALYNLTMKVNRLEMLKANIGLELLAGHSELETFMQDILQGRTEDELKRQAGILGKTVKDNAKTANAIVNASFHNATFSDRVWLYQDLLKEDLSKLLQSGLIQGKNPRVLAKELEKTFGASRFNAERLMRTELARVQTEAQKQSFIKNGFEMYTFHTNTGCCDVCAAINGKHYKVKDMQIGENAAPMHPNCRCSCSAYEDSEEYEQWLDFLANGGTTEEYNKLKAQAKATAKQEENKTTFTPAQTIEEAETLLKEIFTEFDMNGQDIEQKLIIDNANQLYQLEKRFGAIKSTDCAFIANPDFLKNKDGVIAAINDAKQKDGIALKYTMAVRTASFYSSEQIAETVEYSIKKGFLSSADKSKLTIYPLTHEYGHLLQDTVVNKPYNEMVDEYYKLKNKKVTLESNFGKETDAQKRYTLFKEIEEIGDKLDELQFKMKKYDSTKSRVAKECNEEITKIAKQLIRDSDDDFKNATDDEMSIVGYCSNYAKASPYEFFAEAFANSQCGEPNIVGQAMNIWLEEKGW